MKTESIQAITPLVLGGVGLAIGLAVIFSPQISDAKWAAGFGLAGTAIAGASGLAQNRNSDSASIRADRVSIQSTTTPISGQLAVEEEPEK